MNNENPRTVAVKRLVIKDVNRCVGCQLCMLACTRRFSEVGYSKSAILVRSAGGLERGFVVIVCRACKDPPCLRACPVDAISLRKGGAGVIVNYSKCIGCKLCVQACDIGAVMWDSIMEKPIICTHCGYCIDYCPHGVLGLEVVE